MGKENEGVLTTWGWKGSPIKEMGVVSPVREEGGERVASLVVHPGVRLVRIPLKDKGPTVYWWLTRSGERIIERTKGEARGAYTESDLERILVNCLRSLFYQGDKRVEELGLNVRVTNAIRREASYATREAYQEFLTTFEGLPPPLCLGAFIFWGEEDFKRIKNLGKKSSVALKERLEEYNLLWPAERTYLR